MSYEPVCKSIEQDDLVSAINLLKEAENPKVVYDESQENMKKEAWNNSRFSIQRALEILNKVNRGY